MPRLAFIDDDDLDPEAQALIASAERTGAPDPRVVRIMVRSSADAAYARLRPHFSEEEIVELGMLCAQTVGVGRLVRSLNILSWQEACELNPSLS